MFCTQDDWLSWLRDHNANLMPLLEKLSSEQRQKIYEAYLEHSLPHEQLNMERLSTNIGKLVAEIVYILKNNAAIWQHSTLKPFVLENAYAFFTLLVQGGPKENKTPEQMTDPVLHMLFSSSIEDMSADLFIKELAESAFEQSYELFKEAPA